MTKWYWRTRWGLDHVMVTLWRWFGYVAVFGVMMFLSLWLIVQFLGGCNTDPAPAHTPAGLMKQTGLPCQGHDECESGFCLNEFNDGTVVRGGLCTEACDASAGTMGPEAGCPEDFACLRYNKTNEDYCYAICDRHMECQTFLGWFCNRYEIANLNVCIPEIE